MIIKYATYVDNQERVNYPLNFILSKIPNLIVYTSDQENYNYLKNNGIESKIINYKINEPIDISIAQNKCIDDLFKDESVDFVVWNQADIQLTDLGKEKLNNFCIKENRDKHLALSLLHIKLFHLCGYSYFGINAIGRESWVNKFTGDGAYIGNGNENYTQKDYKAETIDIGYLTIEQCKKHLSSHKNIWKNNNDIHLFSNDIFVKEFVKRNNFEGLIKENSEFYYLIEEMNLTEQYKEVCKLLN